MTPPKDRDALIEVMARAFCEKLHGKYFAPFDSHYQAAAEALGRALDRPERKRLKVELYRLLGEREAAVRDHMEGERLARVKA